jgi:Fic family protein
MSAIFTYSSPHQFEPLLPTSLPLDLEQKTSEVVRASARLSAQAHPSARAVIRELVRSMNSYYSNRIEGQGTHPWNIERALRREFSDQPDIAYLQRVALAHIEAERALEQHVAAGENPRSSVFLIDAHRAMYSRLVEADRVTEDKRVIEPGVLRAVDVTIGHHLPPTAASVDAFLKRMDRVYAKGMGGETSVIAVACLHHRAAWVHPFLDGNGRAVRLQSHCALWGMSEGLWSPSRGLARSVADYYARLHNADLPRRGDLDGRGNLTTAGLIEWIAYFIDVCADQVNFMSRMLELDGMKRRIEALITFRSAHDKAMRAEAILPLYHVFAAGPVTRGEFGQLTGLGERTARSLLSRLLATGLVVNDSPLGPVRFGLPLDALQFLLPELYPEAATSP